MVQVIGRVLIVGVTAVAVRSVPDITLDHKTKSAKTRYL
jgi:hypothetical protein